LPRASRRTTRSSTSPANAVKKVASQAIRNLLSLDAVYVLRNGDSRTRLELGFDADSASSAVAGRRGSSDCRSLEIDHEHQPATSVLRDDEEVFDRVEARPARELGRELAPINAARAKSFSAANAGPCNLSSKSTLPA
jgi:hypothetical protein